MKNYIQKFDVIVIGASSSGLFLAGKLATTGLKVGVFERQHTLKPTRRTYIITPHLDKIFGKVPESLILHRIWTMSVETNGRSVDIPLRQPDLVVERSQLITYLSGVAEQAGAKIHYGYQFLGFDRSQSETRILLENSDREKLFAQTKMIVGADGAFSQVAQAAKIRCPITVPLLQAEITLPDDWDAAVTKVWFDVEKTRFFFWLIPESEKRAVVGLIANERSAARETLDQFMAKYNFKVLAYQAGQAAMHLPGLHPWGQVGDLSVMLVGDAASQVKVTTVGGSVTGFWGAQAAANAITKGTNYARELRHLKRELDLHWLIRLLLERLDNLGYDRLVECITPSVQNFLSHRNRDQMAGGFWQLPFLEPRLIGLGLRILFKPATSRLPNTSISHFEAEVGD